MYADENLRVLEITINLELAKVRECLKANKLTLNIKMSNFVTSPVNERIFIV